MLSKEDDTTFFFKETLRQLKLLEHIYGPQFGDQFGYIRKISLIYARFLQGEISAADWDLEIAHVYEKLEEGARELADGDNDCSILSQIRAEREFQMRSEFEPSLRKLSETATGLLLPDSERAASRGLTADEWISEVFDGHRGDAEAQKWCLEEIEDLKRNGLWVWRFLDEDSA